MKSIKTFTRSAALTASLCLVASGFSASAQNADRLMQADANGDGSIEWQEVLDMRATMFSRLDRNDDEVVDTNDSPRFGPGKSRFQEAFGNIQSTADADQDGQITKSEMLDAPAPLFESADTDADGTLSPDELTAVQASAK